MDPDVSSGRGMLLRPGCSHGRNSAGSWRAFPLTSPKRSARAERTGISSFVQNREFKKSVFPAFSGSDTLIHRTDGRQEPDCLPVLAVPGQRWMTSLKIPKNQHLQGVIHRNCFVKMPGIIFLSICQKADVFL